MKRFSEYLPLALLSLFTLKLLVVQSWSFENSLVLVALAGLTSVFQIKSKNDQIQELHELLKKQGEDIAKLQKQDEYLQTSVTSMKIGLQSKPQVKTF